MPRTAHSEVGPLDSVLLVHPREAWRDQATVDASWRDLGYLDRPDFERAVEEYEALIELLQRESDAEIVYSGTADRTTLDGIYARDASVMTEVGAILGRMGKEPRSAEPGVQRVTFEERGIPILGQIEAPGTLEGGDVVWLDEQTLAVGQGYRTNGAGIAQLRALLPPHVEVVVVPLPHHRGPADVFHLMSILSPLDDDLALVHSPLMPVPFRQLLVEHGMELVEVPLEELDSLGCNGLALAPRRCLLASGNPRTAARLREAGVEVITFAGEEISRKGSGGPTCLTRPIWRRSR